MCTSQKKFSNKKRRFQASLAHASDSINMVRGACHNFSFPKHTHEEYTIGMVHSGQEKIWHRGVSHHVGEGSVYFYNPDEAHDGASIDKGGWVFTSIYISPEVFSENVRTNLKETGLPGFSQSVINDEQMSFRFLEFAETLQHSECPMEKESKLLEFLPLLFERNFLPSGNARQGFKRSRKITLAKEYIRENFHEPITLKEVATLVGFHPGYLIEAFQKTEGITPHAYLVAQRVNAARHALLEGLSPTNAAIDCGFYDQSHMNRHFTKTFGLSPAKFQESHKILSLRP